MVVLTKSKMNQLNYKEWITYFEENHEKRPEIDFTQETELPSVSKNLVFPSIRAFQKGEGSDGRHLMKTVDAYIKKHEMPDYRDAMLLFIREENRHSAYLKNYMDFYRISPLKKSFLDKAFRTLRQIGGLKCEITILVTAEMIALTYYDALSKSTDSPVLKAICRQMLHDELRHIMFQSYTLKHMEKSLFDAPARILLMEITSLFVWGAFRNVFRAGGYRFARFLKENLGYLRQSLSLCGQ